MAFQRLLWVIVLPTLVSQQFGCNPYLLFITLSHKEKGSKGNNQSHSANRNRFYNTKFPIHIHPSFLDRQNNSSNKITSQLHPHINEHEKFRLNISNKFSIKRKGTKIKKMKKKAFIY